MVAGSFAPQQRYSTRGPYAWPIRTETFWYFGVPRIRASDDTAVTLRARLQHVVVASRDCVAMAQFYERVLGFTLTDKVVDAEGTMRTAFLRSGVEHHTFAVFQASENRLDHHCYEAGDWGLIRDWADYLAAVAFRSSGDRVATGQEITSLSLSMMQTATGWSCRPSWNGCQRPVQSACGHMSSGP